VQGIPQDGQGVEEHGTEQLHTMLNLLRSLGPLV